MKTSKEVIAVKKVLFLCGLLMSLSVLQTAGADSPGNSNEGLAFTRNKSIGGGMNFGNALEAPTEGEWG